MMLTAVVKAVSTNLWKSHCIGDCGNSNCSMAPKILFLVILGEILTGWSLDSSCVLNTDIAYFGNLESLKLNINQSWTYYVPSNPPINPNTFKIWFNICQNVHIFFFLVLCLPFGEGVVAAHDTHIAKIKNRRSFLLIFALFLQQKKTKQKNSKTKKHIHREKKTQKKKGF